MRASGWFFLALAAFYGAPAKALELSAPVACAIGVECFIQNHVDLKRGPGALDPFCGGFTYDGHEGVDFRVGSLADLERLRPVVRAGAEGVVVMAVDSRLDELLHQNESLFPGDCGNGVTLEHEGGWRTQYCHLRLGSVRLRPGERVSMGQPIGEMGASGATSFPHLHFAVKRGVVPVDPFTGHDLFQGDPACAQPPAPLWSHGSGLRGYVQAPALLGFGLSGRAPRLEDVKINPAALPAPLGGAEFIHIWAHVLGAAPGDEIRLGFSGPDGRSAADEVWRIERPEGVFFASIGVEPRDGGYEIWPGGRYSAHIRLMRGGLEVMRREMALDLAP